MDEIQDLDEDFCTVCNCVVVEGGEHQWWKHGSTQEMAVELREWKRKLVESGEGH